MTEGSGADKVLQKRGGLFKFKVEEEKPAEPHDWSLKVRVLGGSGVWEVLMVDGAEVLAEGAELCFIQAANVKALNTVNS